MAAKRATGRKKTGRKTRKKAAAKKAAKPEVTGCEDHKIPDPDCISCLSKWGFTFDTPNRYALMSVGMLAGRFRPGQSGNPAGRETGRRSFEATVEKLLDAEVDFPIDGQKTLVERREALGRTLISQALRQSPKRWAMELLIGRLWPEKSRHEHGFTGRVQVIFDEDDREA